MRGRGADSGPLVGIAGAPPRAQSLGEGGDAVTVELLYFDGCPSHDALVPHLEELLRSAGIPARFVLRRIEGDDAAHRERFLGSPTVRVDGRDVEPGADEREDFGLKCRLYRVQSALGGSPLDKWVLDALARAQS